MTCNYVMGIISSVALFCPVFLILVLRLGTYRTFPALIIYYSSVFIYNLMTEGHIAAHAELIQNWGLSNNLMDAPLMLTFLLYFSASPVFAQRMKGLIALYVLFEIIVVAIKGFNTEAITIVLGPGIMLVFGFSVYFFIRHTKIAIVHRKAAGNGGSVIVWLWMFCHHLPDVLCFQNTICRRYFSGVFHNRNRILPADEYRDYY